MRKTGMVIAGTVSFLLFKAANAYADIVFPAIANQFMVSFVVGFYWSVLMALLILMVEAFFIQKLIKLHYLIAFILSVVINIISSVAGVVVTSITFGHGSNIFAYGNMRFGTYLGLIPGYTLTVLLEGLILFFFVSMLKRERKGSDCFKTAILMNFVSYLILLAGIFIADIVTKGNNFNIG